MKEISSLQEGVSSHLENQINKVLQNNTYNFNELTEALDLNPETDLRFGDFEGCDFSECDLRNHDFTGANLRSAVGINVYIDDTTITAHADLDRSLFAYIALERRFFAEDASAQSTFERLLKEDWGLRTLEMHKMLKNSKTIKQKQASLLIGTRLFFDSHETAVKTTLLMSLRPSFPTKDIYLSFLLKLFSTNDDNIRIHRVALRSLQAYFRNSQEAANVFLKFARSDDAVCRHLAIDSLSSSKFRQKALCHIVEASWREEDTLQRRRLVKRCAKAIGREDFVAQNNQMAFDFHEEIDRRVIQMASAFQISKKLTPDLRNLSEEERLKTQERKIVETFSMLHQFGIPFQVRGYDL